MKAKNILSAAMAAVMLAGSTLTMPASAEEAVTSGNKEYYPFSYKEGDISWWYYEYDGRSFGKLNWYVQIDEEVDFAPPYYLQKRIPGTTEWHTIDSGLIKGCFNSEDIEFYDYDAYIMEYRVYCPIFLLYECDEDGHNKEISVSSEPIKIRSGFQYEARIKKTSRSRTAVRLNWGTTQGDGTRIQRYDGKNKKWVNVKTVNGSANNARITGLTPGKSYKFRIKFYKRVADKKYPYLKKFDNEGKAYYSNVFFSCASYPVVVRTKK